MEKKIHIPLADKRQHDEKHFDSPELNASEPFELFSLWFEEARSSEPSDANAMSLATVDADGFPNVRMVLLKDLDDNGFVFFTNYQSKKGSELEANPKAALCFHWKSLLRQVRVRGIVEKISAQESDDYFHSRDKKSRIGTWVSQQSRPVAGREKLLADLTLYSTKFATSDVPRPDYWGGYRLIPYEIEFWRNGAFRLHDRLIFSRANAYEAWQIKKLYP